MSESSAPELSVVLPALDEAGSLSGLLPRLKASLEKLGAASEIMIVDGGSTDPTLAVAEKNGVQIRRQQGQGFGSALREGIMAARAPWILLMDADGSHPPESIGALWLRREDAELLIGSRYASGGSADLSLPRRILSWILNCVSRRVLELPVRDSSSGFRLYRASAAKTAAAQAAAKDLSIQQELLVRILAAGGRVVEIPFHYGERRGGVSKSSALCLLPSYLRMLLKLKSLRGGWGAEWSLALVLALGLSTGLCGISGGLPGPARWSVLPESLRGSPAFARKLADSWTRLYAELHLSHIEMRAEEPRTYASGAAEIPPGWTFPPDPLVNSARALLTQSINPDEKKSLIILSRMRPWQLDFEPLYVQYGGAFIYPLGVFLGAVHLLGLAPLSSDLAYYLSRPESMARLYLAGRAYALLFHLGTLILLFEIGRSLSGRRTGAAAALIWSLAPVAISNSHIIKPHTAAAFWFLAACGAMLGAVETGQSQSYLLCGISAGLAAGSSLACGFALGIPILGRLLGCRGSWRAALGSCILGAAVLAVTNPYLVFAPRDFAWEMTVYMPSRFAPSFGAAAALLGRAVPEGLGFGLSVFVAWGILRAFSKDARRRALAIIVLGGTFLVLARLAELSLRFYYPLCAVAVVLAADALFERRRATAFIVFAFVFIETSLRGSVYLSDLRAESGLQATRFEAGRWIDEHIPMEATLGLLRYPEPAHTPFFRWDRHPLLIFASSNDLKGREFPEWIAASDQGWENADAALRGRYEVAREFSSSSRIGFQAKDDVFFANASMRILHRR